MNAPQHAWTHGYRCVQLIHALLTRRNITKRNPSNVRSFVLQLNQLLLTTTVKQVNL